MGTIVSTTQRGYHVFSIIQAAGWPIWPLIICSILGLALVIERFINLQRLRIAPLGLVDEAIAVSKHRLPAPPVVDQLADNSLTGQLLANGFRLLYNNPSISETELRAGLESEGRLAAATMQKYLGALATIASAAPLIGLLGTVIGMIEIFASQGAAGGLSPGGGNPEQLARGIAIALYNTAFGLIVAIPALIFWRYFRAKVDTYVLEMEVAIERFAHHLLTLRA
jgi:biopolymer transport protein ExbB